MKALLINILIFTVFGVGFMSCGANLDTDAKQSAQFYCERVKIEKELEGKGEADKMNDPKSKTASELLNKMNDIRKKYYNTEKWKDFDAAFEKYKAECK